MTLSDRVTGPGLDKPDPVAREQHPLFSTKAKGIRSRIMRATPSWFSVIMGTGIVNTLLFSVPYASTHVVLRDIGAVFLVFDMFLFISFSIVTILRYYLYPRFFMAMLTHETHSLFLGTIPMGLVTITSGIARTGTELGIKGSLEAGLILWWISLVLSIGTSFGVPCLSLFPFLLRFTDPF